jgi:hypothetical protein
MRNYEIHLNFKMEMRSVNPPYCEETMNKVNVGNSNDFFHTNNSNNKDSAYLTDMWAIDGTLSSPPSLP